MKKKKKDGVPTLDSNSISNESKTHAISQCILKFYF